MEPAPRNNDQWNWMRRNGGSFLGFWRRVLLKENGSKEWMRRGAPRSWKGKPQIPLLRYAPVGMTKVNDTFQ
jgi:hypothetical protein